MPDSPDITACDCSVCVFVFICIKKSAFVLKLAVVESYVMQGFIFYLAVI